jgi:hypothetical protein
MAQAVEHLPSLEFKPQYQKKEKKKKKESNGLISLYQLKFSLKVWKLIEADLELVSFLSQPPVC